MSRKAARLADRLTDRVMVQALPLYRRALQEMTTGNDASAEWADLQTLLTRQAFVAILLGMASQTRTLIAQRLIPAPDQSPVLLLPDAAEFDDDDDIANRSTRDTLQDIVNQFLRDIPDLQSVAPRAIEQARQQATGIVMASRDDAPRLMESIIKQIPEVPSTVPATIPDPAASLRSLLETDAGSSRIRRTLDTETRTSMMSGYNRGGRAALVEHQDVLPITVLSEIRDKRTRGNPRGYQPNAGMHYQMHGFTAATDDPIWDRITPPNGYNCRASIRGMSRAKAKSNRYLRADGSVDRDALRRKFAAQWKIIEDRNYPDEGFG